MYAVEKLIEDQKAELRRMLQSPKYRSRSLDALAKGIDESPFTTTNRLVAIGAELHHTGAETGKQYYRLGVGGAPDDTDGTDTDSE